MKKSEAKLTISNKLQKQMHLINSEVQRNNPKMLCDNLASRIMTAIEEMGMLPPPYTPDDLEEYTVPLSLFEFAYNWEEE